MVGVEGFGLFENGVVGGRVVELVALAGGDGAAGDPEVDEVAVFNGREGDGEKVGEDSCPEEGDHPFVVGMELHGYVFESLVF